MKLYRGYVKCGGDDGKSAVEKFKGKTSDELRDLTSARRCDSYGGVLGDNTVLVDVDDLEQADVLHRIIEAEGIRCRIIKTNRGKHFLFRNDGRIRQCDNHMKTAVGLTADFKVGSKDCYESLKINGQERTVLVECDEPDQIPKWLTPVKTKKELYGLGDGDGRNDVIHSYILVLQAEGWGDEEIKHCLNLINTYIFSLPLSQSEFDTATRPEAFDMGREEAFWKDGKLQHNVFGDWMINEYSIKRINGRLHMYKAGVYVPIDGNLEHFITVKMPTIKNSQRQEVVQYIKAMVFENVKTSAPRYIAFKNGIYDLDTDTMMGFRPDFIITNLIPHDYNPHAKADVVDRTLDKLSVNDAQVRALLEEMVGYCFYRKNIFRASFFCTGNKRNGKSTFFTMLENILGQDNFCTVDPNEMGDRFAKIDLFGMLANICDDAGNGYIKNPSVFKKTVTGNTLRGEYKGKDAIKFNPYSTPIFSMNEMPRMDDAGGATTDRMIRVPFDATFSKSDPDFDPHITEKLESEDAMERMIYLAVEALKRVLDRMEFTIPKKCVEALDEYKMANDPVLEFLEDITEDEVVNHSVNDLYGRYDLFCTTGHYRPMSKIAFSKRIKDRFGVDTKPKKLNGKTVKIYAKPQ